MSSTANSFRRLAAVLANDTVASSLFTRFDVSDVALSARLPIMGSAVSIRVVESLGGGAFVVGAYGFSSGAVRWLHDVLVTHSKIYFDQGGREMQIFQNGVGEAGLKSAVLEFGTLVLGLRRQEEAADFSPASTVSMYWSSGLLNFGDWTGPHIVQQLTGRQPVQANRVGAGPRALYTVGSILSWFRRNNVDVWGSGLIKPLISDEIVQLRKLSGVRIHAVRGMLSKQNLEKELEWEVPEVLGDPALLIPDFIRCSGSKAVKPGVVPHYVHSDKVSANPSRFNLIDVRRDTYDVSRAIAQSPAVISSSLHGIIIAQAFGIPWVWLDVTDQPLTGRDFKFEDFFTCLDRDAVSRKSINASKLAEVDFDSLAGHATLPDLNIDLQALRDALPVTIAREPVRHAPDRSMLDD